MNFLRCLIVAVLVWVLVSGSAFAVERFRIREDFDMDPLSDCSLQYYYYIPCPTYSWFWSFYYWETGDVAGAWFDVGDMSTGGFAACDPVDCHTLDMIRILNTGVVCQGPYGTMYPGAYVHFDVYCADEVGRPVGPSLWNSGRMLLEDPGWVYVDVDPPLSICDCSTEPGPPEAAPRILVTITVEYGTPAYCMELGGDNISANLLGGCEMHDAGCLEALYPRPYTSYYPAMHSGFFRQMGVHYDPPKWIRDRKDTTPDRHIYGYVELAWRIYLTCSGPSARSETTWGNIKSMYR
jgi:hypothetical protein